MTPQQKKLKEVIKSVTFNKSKDVVFGPKSCWLSLSGVNKLVQALSCDASILFLFYLGLSNKTTSGDLLFYKERVKNGEK